jgi:hypothetical protein
MMANAFNLADTINKGLRRFTIIPEILRLAMVWRGWSPHRHLRYVFLTVLQIGPSFRRE